MKIEMEPPFPKQVAFVGANLEDLETLVIGLPGVEIVLVEKDDDPITAIRDWAVGRHGYTGLHVFSHGSSGAIHLGNSVLTASSILQRFDELREFGAALSTRADILLYGCEIAASDDAGLFQVLHEATGANIAASTSKVGCKLKGGQWELNYKVGDVTTSAFDIPSYRGILAAPALLSAVAYENDVTIRLIYDQPLDSSNIPQASMFYNDLGVRAHVSLGVDDIPITNISVSGNTLILTIGNIIPNYIGDSFAFTYDDNAGINEVLAIQNSSGEDASSVTLLVNVTPAPAAPTLQSTVAYIGQSTITYTFDQPLDAANPPPTGFFLEYTQIPGGQTGPGGVVLVNGTPVPITNIQISGASLTLSLATTFLAGDYVEVEYDDQSPGDEPLAIQNAAGVDAGRIVSNYTVSSAPPGPSVTSIVSGGGGSTIPAASSAMSYTVTFDSSVTGVDVSDFTLALTGSAQAAITGISGSGTTYSITVSSLAGDGTVGLNLNSSGTGIQDVSNQAIVGGYTGQTVTLDHTAPVAPALALSNASDSGTLGDGITNIGTPTITGTAEANASITLYDTDGATVLGTTTANGSGNWSIVSSVLVEGHHTLTAKQIDAAGNVSPASTGLAYRLDTVGPVGTALSTATVPLNTAVIGATVATVSATDASSVTYMFAVGNGTNDADNGKFTFSGNQLVASQNLTAGTYNVYVRATDAAGNDALQALTFSVVDAPGVSSIVRTSSAPGTAPASATALSYTVTFDQSVTGVDVSDFDITTTGTASGAVSAISGSGTTYTVSVSGITGDGTVRLDLKSSGTGIQNGSSVPMTGGYTSGQTFTLDHTAPLAPATLALALGSDSGTQGDGVTNDGTPSITGTAEANAAVTLFDTDGTTVLGTTTADGAGNWSITSSTVVEGAHTFIAKQTDAAGNVSPASANFAFQLDTIGPVGTAMSRTTVPLSSAAIGATVATVSATDASSVTYSFATGNGANDADNSKFTFSGSGLVANQNLSAGTYNIYVRATDAAGNDALQTLTFDVVNAPGVNSIARANSVSGTVASSSTSVSYTVSFDQAVTNVDINDFTLTTTGSAAGTIASVSGTGATYTVIVDGITGDGTVRLDLNATNTGIQSTGGVAITAGGFSSGETYTLDHTIPLAPGAFTMNALDDTGASNTDAITSVNTPRFSGVGEANATVRLYDTDGTTILGSTAADSGGNWTITSSTLVDGAHSLKVTQTDAAGNISPVSPALAVTIDRTTLVPATPTLAVPSDSGTPGDGRTNITTPTIVGTAEPFATVTLYATDGVTSLGTTTANSTGGWSIVSSVLGEGAHTLTVKQTDRAGNTSAASTALSLAVDTTAPAAGNAPVIAPASDSGTVGDNITDVSRPVISGTGAANASITLYDTNGTTVLGTATADNSGNWTITSSSLSNGAHTLTYTQTDAAGNVSGISSALTLTIIDPPPPPTTVIDGVQVGEQTVNLPGGGSGTQLTIPIVTSGRVESSGSAGVADIPLAMVGSTALLTAQVGVGFGLTSSGGASQPAGSSLERLIQSIIASTPDHPAEDQGYLTGNGAAFLSLLPTTVPLLVQTIVPITASIAPTSTLTLVGTSTSTQHTALVIDVEGVAPTSTISLNAVDFAAIIGAATIAGTTQEQILAGDAAAQKFVVSSNLSSSIFAGGGNDTLQLATPAPTTTATGASAVQAAKPQESDTLLHGGLGEDAAVFVGALADYDIVESDAHLVVTSKSTSDVAYVVNAETLQFSDHSITVEYDASLSPIAGLYVDVLNRQGEIAGVEFWAAAVENGLSLGQLALDFINSTEGRTQQQTFNGIAAHDVEILYEALFNRHSDAEGFAFWVEAMAQGETLVEVAQGFMQSDEASQHALTSVQWDFLL